MFKEIIVFNNGNKYVQTFQESITIIPQVGYGILIEGMNQIFNIERVTLDYKNKRIVINNI